MADTKVGKTGANAVTLAGRIFAVGGWNEDDTDIVEEYSLTANTWYENYIFLT